MNKIILIALGALMVAACSEKPMEQLGDITYRRGGQACLTPDKNHWLLDLKAQNSKDSVYLNTNDLGRKIEVHKLVLDSSSAVFSILDETCESDSVLMILPAKVFYTGMSGSVPPYLKESELIEVMVKVRDKLTDIEHIAYKKMYERNAIDQYVNNLRWNGSRDSITGIVYEKLKTNDKPQSPNKAKVKYLIKSLNEQLIASSQDGDPLLYDAKSKTTLKGIKFLISQLAEGESLRAVVPSDMAYGAEGNKRVPGYMPILIELEILEVLD